MRVVLRRVSCVLVFLLGHCAAVQAAGGLRFTESLGSASSAASTAQAEAAPLALHESVDIAQSLIHELVLDRGARMLGTEYELGASREDAVDCSSLVQRMFRSVGLELPRTAREQARLGVAVAADELEAGDLLFFRWSGRGLHVAVALDDGRILHASTGQREVVVSRLNASWQRRLVSARRLI